MIYMSGFLCQNRFVVVLTSCNHLDATTERRRVTVQCDRWGIWNGWALSASVNAIIWHRIGHNKYRKLVFWSAKYLISYHFLVKSINSIFSRFFLSVVCLTNSWQPGVTDKQENVNQCVMKFFLLV